MISFLPNLSITKKKNTAILQSVLGWCNTLYIYCEYEGNGLTQKPSIEDSDSP